MSRYLVFCVVAITLLTQSTSSTAIAVAFPQITSSYQVSMTLAGWVLSIYFLAAVITVPISGKASDALGRKRTFMFFVLVFTAGSVLCAIAPNVPLLILFRLIQGVGAGGFVTSASGIIADAFPKSRQRSIGLIVSIYSAGMVLGPNLGGWLTEAFGWRSAFWFAVPVGIAVLAAGTVLLKRDKKFKKAHLDIRGAALFAASVGSVMTGLTSLGDRGTGVSWAAAIGLLVFGAVLMAVFLRHEGRVEDPVIDIELLRGGSFAAANAFNIIFGFSLGVLTLLPLYAVTTYGASTIESGLIVTPRAVGLLVGSVVSSFLLVRWGYRKPMIVGVIMMIVAFLFFVLKPQGVDATGLAFGGMGFMLVGVTLSGLGHGVASPAANNACIELMPNRVSTITGVRNACRNVGAALGIAVTSVLLDRLGSITRGFEFVFVGTALVSLLSIPFIFAMPRSPSDVPTVQSDSRPDTAKTEPQ